MPPIPHPPLELIPWPLVVALEDCYVSRTAAQVFADVNALDEETLSLTWECAALFAQESVERRKN